MRFLAKLSITIVVIIFCSQIGKRFSTLGGLIATMPLTGLIVKVPLDYSKEPLLWDEDFRRDILITIIKIGIEVENTFSGYSQDIEGSIPGDNTL